MGSGNRQRPRVGAARGRLDRRPAPYIEDVRRCGEYDVAVLAAPFDDGTTYRSGTRFGPHGIRKISALYGPYSFELGVDLRESITIADQAIPRQVRRNPLVN
jgi:arginase family enzyme